MYERLKRPIAAIALTIAVIGTSQVAAESFRKEEPRLTVMGTITPSNDISAFHAEEAARRIAEEQAKQAAIQQAEAERLAQVAAAKLRASRSSRAPRRSPVQAPVYAEVDGMPGLLRRIGGCESAGDPNAPINWTAQNKHSTASGGFQILDSTWHGWTKAYAPDLVNIPKARLAQPSDQLRVARAAFERQGTGPWVSSRRCWG